MGAQWVRSSEQASKRDRRDLTGDHGCGRSLLGTNAGALKLWGLDTSEKLGRVVYGLVDRGYMERQEGDAQSDFDVSVRRAFQLPTS
jgi:uncharacterized repeat protein (TIGR04138 family)